MYGSRSTPHDLEQTGMPSFPSPFGSDDSDLFDGYDESLRTTSRDRASFSNPTTYSPERTTSHFTDSLATASRSEKCTI